MARNHLAILKMPYLQAILTGSKTIESRLTKTKRAPFGCVGIGDTLFLKASSGPVLATTTVAKVEYCQNLTPGRIGKLREKYNDLIRGSDVYWQQKSDCKYATLIWMAEIKKIEPVRISKNDWRAWVVLEQDRDFGLLKKS